MSVIVAAVEQETIVGEIPLFPGKTREVAAVEFPHIGSAVRGWFWIGSYLFRGNFRRARVDIAQDISFVPVILFVLFMRLIREIVVVGNVFCVGSICTCDICVGVFRARVTSVGAIRINTVHARVRLPGLLDIAGVESDVRSDSSK